VQRVAAGLADHVLGLEEIAVHLNEVARHAR
jgi:hypothetical protein